jgi:hypothetical protein
MIFKGSLPHSIFSVIHRSVGRAVHDPCLFSIYDHTPDRIRHDVSEHIHNAVNASVGFDLRHHAYSAVHNIINSYVT